MIFDSSAIVNLASSDRMALLRRGTTVGLAEFEIGNMIWNRIVNLELLDARQGAKLLETFRSLLLLMGHSAPYDSRKALTIAVEEKVTFYDAVFIEAAVEDGSALVTDDKDQHRAASRYVEAVSSGSLKA